MDSSAVCWTTVLSATLSVTTFKCSLPRFLASNSLKYVQYWRTSQVCGVADSCSEITIPALMIDRINGEDFLSEVRWYLSMLEVSHVNSYLLWMDVTNNDASCTRNTANASYRLSFWAPICYRSPFSSSFPLQNLLKDGASYCSRTYSYILLNPPLLPRPLTPFLAPTLFYQGNNVS